MASRTFGRKGQAYAEEMARRREAFISEERARKETLAREGPIERQASAATTMPSPTVYVREKSMFVAYLLWFFFGGVSAHRHYLGYHTSALIQGGMWLIGLLLVLSLQLYGVLLMGLAGLWIFADAFVIPSLVRDANARARQQTVHYAFT